MEEIRLKIDSKGRVCIPSEVRETMGDTVTLKRTSEGFLIISGKPVDFLAEFRKVISSEPKRKGKPKLASPREMKSIWRTNP